MIALVGKNGVGKTTLMKTINGDQDIDNGKIWNLPGIKVSYFNQNFIDFDKTKTLDIFQSKTMLVTLLQQYHHYFLNPNSLNFQI